MGSLSGRSGALDWKAVAALMAAAAALITAAAAIIPTLRDGGDTRPEPDAPPVTTIDSATILDGDDARPEADAPPVTIMDSATIRIAEALATRWIAALKDGNVDNLVELATPPFYMDNEIRVSKADIRERYTEMVGDGGVDLQVTRLDARQVGEFREAGLLDQRDRILSSMRIEDDDFAVGIFVGGEGIIVFFRRVGNRLEMAGFWD